MKKSLKIIIIVFIALFLLVSVPNFYKHGWKLWGFEKCENPNGTIYVTDVYVADDLMCMQGETTSSALKYIGYTYKLVDKTLYVGVKYGIFGDRGSDFYVKIEEDFSDLENVILTNGSEERCVWNLDKDKKYMEKIKQVRLYESISIDDEIDYKEQMKNTEFVYADAELLNKIQHPTFSDGIILSKSGYYLGVAELENGEELYLEFERNYNLYYIIGVFGHYNY